MASWKGTRAELFSPSPMDPAGACEPAGHCHDQEGFCSKATTPGHSSNTRYHICTKRYKELLQSRTHPHLWVLLRDKTALPSYYKAEANPEAKSYKNFKCKFSGVWSGNPAAPTRCSLHEKPRAAAQSQGTRHVCVGDCGVTRLLPDACPRPQAIPGHSPARGGAGGDPKAKQEGSGSPRATPVLVFPAHLRVSCEHLDPLRGDKQIHLGHGLGLPLWCLQNDVPRKGHGSCQDSSGSLPHSWGGPLGRSPHPGGAGLVAAVSPYPPAP